MSNEDKMREEFEQWLFEDHILPKQSISFTAEEMLFKLWSDLKACAAIKDAEIAARDLMIKELQSIVDRLLTTKPGAEFDLAIFDAKQLLANSEHHNSRALEKMLLEARIEEISQYEDVSTDAFERMRNLKAKLAELNKEHSNEQSTD